MKHDLTKKTDKDDNRLPRLLKEIKDDPPKYSISNMLLKAFKEAGYKFKDSDGVITEIEIKE
jgi:hypothetical protein